MSESTENTKPRNNKKPDWKSAAASVGWKFLEVALTGIVVGVSGAVGQRLVHGSQPPVRGKLSEGDAEVVPIRKFGNA